MMGKGLHAVDYSPRLRCAGCPALRLWRKEVGEGFCVWDWNGYRPLRLRRVQYEWKIRPLDSGNAQSLSRFVN